ncbi:acyltransferase family protein [Glycomyces harbinensis]|uniref:Peptidoglycan/LPS O-acetylase OafA/YrhL, contains acyltransferase and SGNH-hydrolase domains n=1 Tax=Glycomyces harbinensis TaxID=58114 RepID=A0A1G6YQF6_9ACTN|nr:acyltransferase family protein [Glycomyces harbinensis]SDD92639.1 Peptidoglycan/LPS O-acetylase OafA/YrhL, contains acyltransferase and SGNH-hydrolase domains [Glycomyces harbinensis]
MSATATPADTAAPAAAPAARAPRLREIDGLRGLAIAVIAVYHIWFDRVSGGVDVFLLLSGFFITASLLRTVEKTATPERAGSVAPLAFAARIVRRIFPPALVVAAATVLMTVIWLPRATWNQQLGDILATALYYGNWHLALNSVDYLSSNNGASIVQHYWSMGIQAQFYVLWPILIGASAWLAHRAGRGCRRVLAVALAAVFAASFAFALWETAENQAFAYFDLRARLWQFAAGGLLAVALPRLQTAFAGPDAPQRRVLAAALGWAGVAVLLGAGFFLESTQFPGLAALWPVGGACAVVIAASLSPGTGAGHLLNARPVQWLGDLSYTLYLWHWPVLICYLTATGRDTATLMGGLGVLAAATLLAWATRWALEQRLPATGLGQRTKRGAFALGAACLALVLASYAALTWYVSFERDRLAEAASDASRYPGAAALAEGLDVPEADFTPSTLDAAEDYDPALSGRCNQTMEGYEPVRCDFGAEESEAAATVVMYGGSKIWQWLPAVLEAAEAQDWHVIAYTKNACIIETGQEDLGEERYRSCAAWNDAVVAEIDRIGPELVFTYGSRVGYEAYETFPDYTDRYEQLLATGAAVVAIRDTPSPRFDIPLCVDLNGAGAAECAVDRSSYYEEGAFASLEVPEGVRKVDLTDYICGPRSCEPVVGNVLVYRDDAHLTNTYAATLGPYLEAELAAALAARTGAG